MAVSMRKGMLFAAGILLGAAGALALVHWRGGDEPRSRQATPATAVLGAPAATPAVAPVNCSFTPAVARGGEGDGQIVLQSDLGADSNKSVGFLLVMGKEAAAAGRARDAEAAFLMACRAAEKMPDSDRMPLADAMYQLGRHYANVGKAPQAERRQELLRRAEALLEASLQAYRAKHGDKHEKVRFAADALAAMRQQVAQTPKGSIAPPAREIVQSKKAETKPEVKAPEPPPVVKAPEPPPVVKAPELPKAETKPAPRAAARVEPTPAPQAKAEPRAEPKPAPRPQAAARERPSFDCGKARSTTEKLICADDDLARQDRELGRLHSRARDAAPDRRAFQRRSDAEWQRRESTCTDRDCLDRWYAERRAALRE
jgi:outer membrane biosynthesis protein TonB